MTTPEEHLRRFRERDEVLRQWQQLGAVLEQNARELRRRGQPEWVQGEWSGPVPVHFKGIRRAWNGVTWVAGCLRPGRFRYLVWWVQVLIRRHGWRR